MGEANQPSESGLTPEEHQVLDALKQAWNSYVKLPLQHPMHHQEFAHAIHAAQRLVMSRPVSRAEGWVIDTYLTGDTEVR